MTAPIEMEAGRSIADYWAMLRRRRRIAWRVVLGVFALAALTVLLWPAKYRSSATILIEQQEIPQDLVRSTITSFADQRIQVLSQQVMTTSNLLRIVKDYGLYSDMIDNHAREEILEEMRGDTRMRMISAEVVDPRSGRPTSATIAFTLSYDGRNPDQALKVASELTNLFLAKNVQSRTETANQNLAFLTGEAERLSGEIREIEARLADFKADNVGRLPELTQLNLNLLDRAERELQDVDRRLLSLNERRIYLDAEVARLAQAGGAFTDTGERIYSPNDRLKYVRGQLASLEGIYSDQHPDVVRARRELVALESSMATTAGGVDDNELVSLEAERAATAARLSDSHPDVRALDRQITALRAGRDARAENIDPAYRQIEAQFAAALAEIDSLEVLRLQLLQRVRDYETRLAQTPIVERDYAALTLELEDARTKFRNVKARELEARLSQSLEADRRGERLTVIEPPLPAEQPISPDRPLLLAVAAFGALLAGIGAIVIAESADTTLRDRAALEAVTHAPLLGLVPEMRTVAQRSQGRVKVVAALGAVVGVGLIAAACIHFLVIPLDVAVYSVMRRVGLS